MSNFPPFKCPAYICPKQCGSKDFHSENIFDNNSFPVSNEDVNIIEYDDDIIVTVSVMNKTDCHNCGQIHHICGQIYKQTNLVSGFFPTNTLYVCVAPMLLATSSLLSIMSVITTSEAPMALAVRRLTRPIGPAPQIKTLLPRETPARLETSRMLV